MGNLLSLAWRMLSSQKHYRIVMLGLDNAGKTTILYKLKLGELVTTIPTIGFNVEQVTYRNISFNIWDVGGQTKIRQLWRYYFQNTDALIYVVDSADRMRMDEAKSELQSILADPDMTTVKVLVYANKQDLPNAAAAGELARLLELDQLRTNVWNIQASNAKSAEGLVEGLEWLEKELR